MKITIIGAGSLGFTRRLLQDLFLVPEFNFIEVALTDIQPQYLDMIMQVVQRDITANGLQVKLSGTTDRRKALKDADYIINCVRIGGLEVYESDIEIPLRYGIDQCVGDTLGPGGIFYGQRGIAALLDFCKDIREVSRPNVLMLNYSNPNAMMTWAANVYGGVKTIGLCHGVQHGHEMIANVIELLVNKGRSKNSKAWKKVTMDDVDIICAGINHQTWYIQVKYDGQDWCGSLLEGFEAHPEYSKTEKVRIDMLRNFGYFSTESNGHLSEYLPWYRKNAKETRKWIDLSSWINGETGGYLRVCKERRDWFKTDFPKIMKDAPWDMNNSRRSVEHGGYIIEALETGRLYRGHFNLPNQGAITNLSDDAVVEVPGYIDANGINIPKVGNLPAGCAAVCERSIQVQRLSVEAAVEGNLEKLRQAMMLDPLTGAICTPPEIWQMTDAMLAAQAKWLPQYKKEIPAAHKRLSSEKNLGTKSTKGAARVKRATLTEIRSREKARSQQNMISTQA